MSGQARLPMDRAAELPQKPQILNSVRSSGVQRYADLDRSRAFTGMVHMVTHPAALDVPREVVLFVLGLVAARWQARRTPRA